MLTEREEHSSFFSFQSYQQKTGFGNCPKMLPLGRILPKPSFCQLAGPEESITMQEHTALQNPKQPLWITTMFRHMKHVGFAELTPRRPLSSCNSSFLLVTLTASLGLTSWQKELGPYVVFRSSRGGTVLSFILIDTASKK